MDSVISFVRRIIPPTETDFYIPSTWVYDGSLIDMDFMNSRYWDDPNFVTVADLVSCTRASIGYAKTAAGVLTQFAVDTFRLTDLGLLVERLAQNLFSNSQAYDGLWGLYDATVLDNQTTAPDGTSTAAKETEGASNSRHMIYSGSSGGVTNGVFYSFSCFAKAGTRRYFSLGWNDGVNALAAVYDLQTGTITDTHVQSGSPTYTFTIEQFTNGWYRCVLNTDAGQTNGAPNMMLGLSNSATPSSWDTTPSYQGDGSSFLYIWGAQIELGVYASSYIPSSGGVATRAADKVLAIGDLNTALTATNISILANVIATAAILSDVPATHNYGRIIGDDGTGTGIAPLFRNDDDTHVASFDGVTALSVLIGNSLTFSGGVKVAFAQSAGGRSIVGGGGTVATDANHVTYTTSASLGYDANYPFNGYFRRVTVWNSRLSDTILQIRTAP